MVTALRSAGSGYVVQIGSGPGAVELPVSRRHSRDVRKRLRGGWKDQAGDDPDESLPDDGA